jgi:hypothetical protein
MHLKEIKSAVLVDLEEEFIDLRHLLESDCKVNSKFNNTTPDLAFSLQRN